MTASRHFRIMYATIIWISNPRPSVCQSLPPEFTTTARNTSKYPGTAWLATSFGRARVQRQGF